MFVKPDVVNAVADEYMFLSCIKYINQVKTGPFAEHSNQLWSISGVSTWSKINSGLIKMYKTEVSEIDMGKNVSFAMMPHCGQPTLRFRFFKLCRLADYLEKKCEVFQGYDLKINKKRQPRFFEGDIFWINACLEQLSIGFQFLMTYFFKIVAELI